ncbi:hypothetical protein MLD38_036121 [Melastoma candidum]|uniref:Uncharacterized protein n=1 Tax=Melastoma candidum TaxID=119954 RepID=A0ACB9LKJ9_9MYRT|nr:hypothetical protein MLD38_036121 [Melastoma candidum]
MAPTTDVHASPSKKARTEKEEQVVEKPYVAPSFMCFFGEEPDDFDVEDSYGVARTYETLIYPMFREDDAILEIFRVKPYAPVERPGRNEVEKLLA